MTYLLLFVLICQVVFSIELLLYSLFTITFYWPSHLDIPQGLISDPLLTLGSSPDNSTHYRGVNYHQYAYDAQI